MFAPLDHLSQDGSDSTPGCICLKYKQPGEVRGHQYWFFTWSLFKRLEGLFWDNNNGALPGAVWLFNYPQLEHFPHLSLYWLPMGLWDPVWSLSYNNPRLGVYSVGYNMGIARQLWEDVSALANEIPQTLNLRRRQISSCDYRWLSLWGEGGYQGRNRGCFCCVPFFQ